MHIKETEKISFRPLEDAELSEIAKRQSECLPDLSEILDNKPRWAPLSEVQVRERIADELKKPHTAVFAIYGGETFVGIGEWSASWDSWSPYAWLMIWPEYRRKGLGRRVAEMLLERCFVEHPGHVVVTATADWNMPTVKFVKALGFADIGRMRRTHMHEGKYHETLFFDILKSEYLDRQKGVRR